MKTVNFQGVEIEGIRNHHVLLPKAWKETKSWFDAGLKYTLAKTWECEQQIFAFSAWIVGRLAISCSLEYQKATKSCTIVVNSVHYYGANSRAEKNLIEALRIVLNPS